MKYFSFLVLALVVICYPVMADNFVFSAKAITVVYDKDAPMVVQTAMEIFASDFRQVFGVDLEVNDRKGNIYITTVGKDVSIQKKVIPEWIEALKENREGFLVFNNKKNLYVIGSDARGTAYGILELSRMIGVSPWVWWADAVPEQMEEVKIEDGFFKLEYPSVKYRGIFINDEDWGLTPWSYKNYEPSEVEGQIGPKTHARIFELLLRLRANAFWPAMHECSVPFYFTPGNKEVADKYGILLGTSHCEPMMRNTNGEWKVAGKGNYDFVNNRESVVNFWEERVKELASSENIYTLGIRGVHDSKMLGANTIEEQRAAITEILKVQRELLAKYIDSNVENIPQVFIPYKEVLDVYNAGLEVPEDVTLMWCDDNYGYIRHFPDEKERLRKGGNGVYYHISYWGRPHDYLWLSSAHPALVYTQMKQAYEKGAKDVWILNVGDIKPAEYLIEMFMDLAWNVEGMEDNQRGLDEHMVKWMAREFGEEYAVELAEIMNEYYRLAYIRKPEFMGNTRTEERDAKYKIISDLCWTEEELYKRLEDYKKISNRVEVIRRNIPVLKKDCFYQLVEYSVLAATEMNRKLVYAQLARHGKEDWKKSDNAYDRIVTLTEKYNSLNNGKWRYMMDFQPRKLPVFERVPQWTDSIPLISKKKPFKVWNGNEYEDWKEEEPVCYGMGYERGAVHLKKGSSVVYTFEDNGSDSVRIHICLSPNHPVEGNKLRYRIEVDERFPVVISYETKGRSEQWKQNILNNQAVGISKHVLQGENKHTVRITAEDEGVVIDQVKVFRY